MTSQRTTTIDSAAACEQQSAACGRLESFDVAEYEHLVKPWDVRFNQLSGGGFHAQLRYVRTPGMLIYDERWSERVDVRGATPDGLIMVGTNVAWRRSEISWCGVPIDHRRWACRGPAGEVDFMVPERSHQLVVLVEPELMRSGLGRDPIELFARRTDLGLSAIDGQRLMVALRRSLQKYEDRPELLRDVHEVMSLESHVLDMLGRCVDEGDGAAGPASKPARALVLRRAIEYIESADEPVTSLQVARAVGVGQRTLAYAFRDGTGVTPVRYMRLHRLNRAHRDLSAADPRSSAVGAIARAWGFGHLGRFAVDHRTLFGESPSATLARYGRSPATRIVDLIRSE